MKYSKNKLILIIILLLVALFYSIYASKRGGRIKSGDSFYWAQLLNVHESPTTWLSVDGQRFDNVLGSKPYFLEISPLDTLFFVTSDKQQTTFIYHFLNKTTHVDTQIPVKYTFLGQGIGTAVDYYRHDWVDRVEGKKVTILSRFNTVITQYDFDLEQRAVYEVKHTVKP